MNELIQNISGLKMGFERSRIYDFGDEGRSIKRKYACHNNW